MAYFVIIMITKNKNDFRKLDDILIRLLGRRKLSGYDRMNIEFNNLAEKTSDFGVLCSIAIYTENKDTLNTILKRSDSFDKSEREWIVMNCAGNKYADPIMLDRIARGRYPLVTKMEVVMNPTTYSKTVYFIAVSSRNEKLRKLAQNTIGVHNINEKLRK